MRNLILGLLATALVGAGLVAVPASAGAAPYPGSVRTTTIATGPAKFKQGHRPKTTAKVSAAGNARPVGQLKVRYQRKQGGFTATKTVKYKGKKVSFRGPKLKKRGKYVVRVQYRPKSDSVWTKSTDSYTFKVVK